MTDFSTESLGDFTLLKRLNDVFIQGVREGDTEKLNAVLAPKFAFMDGIHGKMIDKVSYCRLFSKHDLYAELTCDQVYIRVDGNTAIISGRTTSRYKSDQVGVRRVNRYVDCYVRLADSFQCVFACLWRLNEKDLYAEDGTSVMENPMQPVLADLIQELANGDRE